MFCSDERSCLGGRSRWTRCPLATLDEGGLGNRGSVRRIELTRCKCIVGLEHWKTPALSFSFHPSTFHPTLDATLVSLVEGLARRAIKLPIPSSTPLKRLSHGGRDFQSLVPLCSCCHPILSPSRRPAASRGQSNKQQRQRYHNASDHTKLTDVDQREDSRSPATQVRR